MTQSDLGEALGVSRQTINSIEGGRYLPSLPLAFRMARLFETELERIFEVDEEDR
jgi:putative transcriptional regulator